MLLKFSPRALGFSGSSLTCDFLRLGCGSQGPYTTLTACVHVCVSQNNTHTTGGGIPGACPVSLQVNMRTPAKTSGDKYFIPYFRPQWLRCVLGLLSSSGKLSLSNFISKRPLQSVVENSMN